MSREKSVVDYPNSIETRVALLERSIDDIRDILREIKQDMKEMRSHFDKLMAGLYFMFGSSLLTLIYKLIHG